MKSEVVVLLLATLALVVALVGHIAIGFMLNVSALGMVAAPVPFVLMLVAVIAVKYAAAHDKPAH
ncbi:MULTISPECIES: hypothetical protein [Shewanella]|uniref:Uncharacterized protein n=3 Tax=Shewanella TaxID=22 RepID=A1S976_SHEAM|nr:MULTISPECIES: hypothetical protein [Shewanella]ABM00933.1 hypothetical protein Sama_2730 [Shewanella amazonensis SB2B]MCL2918923.1 hypothetical protein [Shewanella litorisediminis]QRH00994.1 hypothetical protein JQC75_14145 [Shewanella litorisediminis]QYJ74508.1 hypothetical protein K0H79_14240 [Shewanella sp. FJAT-52076]